MSFKFYSGTMIAVAVSALVPHLWGWPEWTALAISAAVFGVTFIVARILFSKEMEFLRSSQKSIYDGPYALSFIVFVGNCFLMAIPFRIAFFDGQMIW